MARLLQVTYIECCDRVVTLIVPPAGPSDGAEPMAANLLGVINAMGERGGPWDLDADGLVTEADLSVLLGGGGGCR